MEDPICPYKEISSDCKIKCQPITIPYEECKKRIAAKHDGDCEAWYFDFYKCVDKCRAPQIMKHVK